MTGYVLSSNFTMYVVIKFDIKNARLAKYIFWNFHLIASYIYQAE
jgi:hypothetical protein